MDGIHKINEIKKLWQIALFMLLWGAVACGGEEEDIVVINSPIPSKPPITGEPTVTPTYFVAPTFTPTPTVAVKMVVCIDPGHQLHGDAEQEPIGPGSTEMKARVTGGTTGVVTKLPEYKLTLTVSLLLKDELEARGYKVVLTRTEHDVNLSNSERAKIAGDAEADAFIRIHANSAETKINGVLTMCQTSENPYNSELYGESRLLSQCILDGFLAATDARSLGVRETDTMSGINWSTVPVSIVEMGFLSDPDEDVLLSDPEYQRKMVKGMADGIDLYFLEHEAM